MDKPQSNIIVQFWSSTMFLRPQLHYLHVLQAFKQKKWYLSCVL